jgi:pimeloyl-ACP methyl ester carboxylesterase
MFISTAVALASPLLDFAGLAALGLGAMLAAPLRRPAPFAPIQEGAMKLDMSGQPALSRFQARDGTWLAYRIYPAAGGARSKVAILAHGSSASSDEMNPMAKALAGAGVTAVAFDARGHGASGGRGDIGYIGQMEHDLADLLDHLGADHPQAAFQLLGHSLGAGFAARIAGTALGAKFERFVLIAPFLGAQAPTSGQGNKAWASPDIPRILALAFLQRFGITLGQSLPVIAFANDPAAGKYVTSIYSYRLLFSYGPDFNWKATKATIAAAAAKMRVISGADDELMLGAALTRELAPLGVEVKLLAGLDHMATVYDSAALAAIVATVKAA